MAAPVHHANASWCCLQLVGPPLQEHALALARAHRPPRRRHPHPHPAAAPTPTPAAAARLAQVHALVPAEELALHLLDGHLGRLFVVGGGEAAVFTSARAPRARGDVLPGCWARRAARRAARRRGRARSAGVCRAKARTTSCVSRLTAFHTLPYVPSPSSLSTLYLRARGPKRHACARALDAVAGAVAAEPRAPRVSTVASGRPSRTRRRVSPRLASSVSPVHSDLAAPQARRLNATLPAYQCAASYPSSPCRRGRSGPRRIEGVRLLRVG
jgi:hypothetical protein